MLNFDQVKNCIAWRKPPFFTLSFVQLVLVAFLKLGLSLLILPLQGVELRRHLITFNVKEKVSQEG